MGGILAVLLMVCLLSGGRTGLGERVGLGLTVPLGWEQDAVPFAFVIRRALTMLQEEGALPKELEWDVVVRLGCEDGAALAAGADLIYRHNVSALFGATLSSGTEPLGLLAAELNLPLFPNSAKSSIIGAGKIQGLWNTTSRVIEASDPIGRSLADWLEGMGWLEVALMADPQGSDLLYNSLFQGIVDPVKIVDMETFSSNQLFDPLLVDQALDRIAESARVVILGFATIVPGEGERAARFVLSRAKAKGMVGAEWVWVVPLGMDSTLRPGDVESLPSLFADLDPEALRHVFVQMPTSRSDHLLLKFMDTFRGWAIAPDAQRFHPEARTIFGDRWERLSWHVLLVMLTHDAALLYGLALQRCYATAGCQRTDGARLVRLVRRLTFTGMTGEIRMKESFDRAVSYNIIGLNPRTLRQEVYWRYTLEYNESDPESTATGVTKLRRRQLEKDALAKSWEFRMSQVQLLLQTTNSRPMTGSSSTVPGEAAEGKEKEALTAQGELIHGVVHGGLDRLGFVGQGRLSMPGQPKRSIALKQYRRTPHFHPRLRSELLALKTMMELDQDNLTCFVGLSLDCGEHLLVGWEHCSKGSLADVLFHRDVPLDQVFTASIVRDVVSGLAYLHSCPLGVHGQLTLENCVVSGRWLVKLTDFGLPEALRQHRLSGDLTFKPCSVEKLLHVAPELLLSWRQGVGQTAVPTKAADVYSLAMVVYQVLTRQALYDAETMTEEEAKDNLFSGRLTGLRPQFPASLPEDPGGELALHLGPAVMRSWQWDPDARPTIKDVQRVVGKLKSGRKNIVEHMMSVLENYAGRLEAKVASRTAQVAEEKAKADELLGRMLPASVVEKLKSGKEIPPESFDSVTVFFSDVAGFTKISSTSDPIQVVELLNRLYGELDGLIERFDAYKVETIGDSYMIVSGLPRRNGRQHVVEMARLAQAMLQAAGQIRVAHLGGRALTLRAGLHTGPCAAGVLGNTMPRYCLFGDTVNTASRMETTSEAGKIQVSEATAKCLEETGGGEAFELSYRGTVHVKGKGEMPTYWLKPSTAASQTRLHPKD